MSRLPPAEKLPLAVRKNIRDSWENTKEDHEKKLSETLGQPWTINIDPKSLYPYAEEGSWGNTSMGDLIVRFVSFVEGVEYQLKYFIEQNGDGAKDEINEICSGHVLTMDFDEKNTVSYCGTKVGPEGELIILFTNGNLGTNTSYAADANNITKALNEAPSTVRPMSYVARASIRSDYDPNVQQIQEKLNKILGQEITIAPNFEANFEKLQDKASADSGWEQNFGRSHFSYLEGLVSQLEYDKFGEDDMLQEGLLEAMEKHAVHVRVVDKTKRSYNETVIEDGILYLQTTPSDFGVNVHQIASDIVNIL